MCQRVCPGILGAYLYNTSSGKLISGAPNLNIHNDIYKYIHIITIIIWGLTLSISVGTAGVEIRTRKVKAQLQQVIPERNFLQTSYISMYYATVNMISSVKVIRF